MVDVALYSAQGQPVTELEAVITMIGLIFKLVKWLVIAVVYLLMGLAKLVSIVVVVAFFTGRAGVRHLLDARDRREDDEDEYDLGYPSHVGRSSERLTQDAFDARWQRERDHRVAERRASRGAGVSIPAPDGRLGHGTGNAAVPGGGRGNLGRVTATANGRVRHEARGPRRKSSERSDRGATVIRP